MCHVKSRLSPNLQPGGSVVLFFVFLTLIHSCRGQSEAIVPSQPIVSLVGDDVILPCYLKPPMNAFNLTVEWSRSDLYVFAWHNSVELQIKHPSYRGRTSLFTGELKNGNISLKISKVNLSDGGKYTCLVTGLANTVQLVVAAPSSPVIQYKNNSGEVVLQCESTGWYPEPEVLWLDAEGNLLLSAGPPERVRGPDDLYTVSSRVTVEKRHSNKFTCRVQQRNINQTRETQIHVPDHFFIIPAAPETPGNLNTTAVWVPLVVIILFLLIIPAVVFVEWKKKQIKCDTRRSHDDGLELDVCNTESGQLLIKQEKITTEENGENDPQVVNESKIHEDQFVTKAELQMNEGGKEGERTNISAATCQEPLITTEPETQQGRQVDKDLDKCEGEELKRGDNLGPQVDLHLRKGRSTSDSHTDQKLGKGRKKGNEGKLEREIKTQNRKNKQRPEDQNQAENQKQGIRDKLKEKNEKVKNESHVQLKTEVQKTNTELSPQNSIQCVRENIKSA